DTYSIYVWFLHIFFQPQPCPFRETNEGHFGVDGFYAISYQLRGCNHPFPEIFPRHHARPPIEKLNGLCPCIDLCYQIIGCYFCKQCQQHLEYFRVVICKPPCGSEILAATTFEHICRDCPRCTCE